MAERRIVTRALRHPKPSCESDLFKLLQKIGSRLNQNDVKLLLNCAGQKLEENVRCRIKNGLDFLDAIARNGVCDESNLQSIFELLSQIKRHDLLHLLHTRGRTEVLDDPVEEYLSNQLPQSNDTAADGCSRSNQTLRIARKRDLSPSLSHPSTSAHRQVRFLPSTVEPPRKQLRRSERFEQVVTNEKGEKLSTSCTSKQKYTCDVRLRVRAEYCNYEAILQATVSSNKQDPIERQSDCFSQANVILRARDLGYIVCDIKFSEITYLDAFWRDYLNGSLLEALKGVFITETLKQAVGNESIKLLVHVDEDDYVKGRAILLKNIVKVE